jgi:hypothetical protein
MLKVAKDPLHWSAGAGGDHRDRDPNGEPHPTSRLGAGWGLPSSASGPARIPLGVVTDAGGEDRVEARPLRRAERDAAVEAQRDGVVD